jgi:predicted nuclease with TOPRIM domain
MSSSNLKADIKQLKANVAAQAKTLKQLNADMSTLNESNRRREADNTRLQEAYQSGRNEFVFHEQLPHFKPLITSHSSTGNVQRQTDSRNASLFFQASESRRSSAFD